MEPNCKLTLLLDGAGSEHDVWVLAGDHISAGTQHPMQDGANFFDVSQRRSAHVAYRAAIRHGLVPEDTEERDFIDGILIEIDLNVKKEKKDPVENRDGLGPFDEASADNSSKSAD